MITDLKDEEWRQVKGFPLYFVSNMGRIKSERPRLAGNKGTVPYQTGWRLLSPKSINPYLSIILRGPTGSGIKRQVNIHRLVAETFLGEIPKDMVVDHINRDISDNRLANLRIATHRQNLCNSSNIRNSTGYKGVYKNYKRFQATIRNTEGKRIHLGIFKTPEEAALAYNKAALEYHGDFAVLNKVEAN